jgi:16S rRNA (cytosine1402-N4)-methyltransferase
MRWEISLTIDLTFLKETESRGHIPVLAREVLQSLPQKTALKVLDGTFGRGGHARLIDQLADVAHYAAMDRDGDALEATKEWKPKGAFSFYDGPFSEMAKFVQRDQLGELDVIFLDIGVSSPQLDRAERGFSFMKAGPLDMRMDDRRGPSASDLVMTLPEDELADIIFQYGEERASRRIAKAIVQQRSVAPIRDTHTLAAIIESVLPRSGKLHPATRTFQALRIAVNEELDELEKALAQALSLLAPQGRLIVISFHSLEDRMVKQAFQAWKKEKAGTIITKKCLMAMDDESRLNPRSRSAKLRVFEKGVS